MAEINIDLSLLNRILSPPLGLNPPSSPPELYTSAVAHFSSIPWCASLLSEPGVVALVPSCRNPITDKQDQLFARTLANDRALRQQLCFFTPDDPEHLRDPLRPVGRVSTLFALGEGVSGYPSVVHGGMTMAMVDEAMGVVTELNTALRKQSFAQNSVTASLEIKFIRPIPTDGVVCATTWLESVEGRKARFNCEVRDSTGAELARSTSTWLALKSKV